MKTVIYLIRHGESLGNKNRICLGHTDLDLTERGFKQAELTAKQLSDVEISAIYSSDLIRAYNTALPNAEARGLEISTTQALRELYFGEWENRSVVDIIEEYGDMFPVGWRQHFASFTPPGGDSVQVCAERMDNELRALASCHIEEQIIVVSHAAAIRALWGRINCLSPEEASSAISFPSNASYSVIEFDGVADKLIPISYSNDEHLAELITVIPE
jgi:broad specificity phosphatase PhoE